MQIHFFSLNLHKIYRMPLGDMPLKTSGGNVVPWGQILNGKTMADKMTEEQRHYCMSRIRSVDTRPEMVVRKFLHASGFRYSLHRKDLPGSPDIVLKKYHTVIFINAQGIRCD